MRDSIEVSINGRRTSVKGDDAFLTLSDFLRLRLGLVGTKIVCSEGDCGACGVLLGTVSENKTSLSYRSVDSCILFMHQLDRTHVISVEGLSTGETGLSTVQQAMIDCHGSQCGYCTPGFVMAMHGLVEENSPLDTDSLKLGLSGNLCRCTGYVQILDAGKSVDPSEVERMNQRYPPAEILSSIAALGTDSVGIRGSSREVFIPQTMDDAIAWKARHLDARIVSGATDVGVQQHHGRPPSGKLLCLSGIDSMKRIECVDGSLVIGAGATWSMVLPHATEHFPEFAAVLKRFGSPQIRNAGTVGGNLANASPIADSLPFLYAVDACLTLRSVRGSRTVRVTDFYQGYKLVEMLNDELIETIHCPLPKPHQHLRLYKTSKRRDMDISTFGAGFMLEIIDDVVQEVRIALGGVGPTVVRLPQAEAALRGKIFSLQGMRGAGKIARDEITPISDVRGSKDYRSELAANIFVKCYYDVASQAAGVV